MEGFQIQSVVQVHKRVVNAFFYERLFPLELGDMAGITNVDPDKQVDNLPCSLGAFLLYFSLNCSNAKSTVSSRSFIVNRNSMSPTFFDLTSSSVAHTNC